jgi:hypothetical protein
LAAPFLLLMDLNTPSPLTFILSVHRKDLEFWLSIVIGHVAIDLEIQISNELQQSLHVEGIEDVRLIKDKRTGKR